MHNNLFIAFWNVENLFDVETAERPEKIKKMVKKELKGWNDAILGIKLAQLSKVIRAMNDSAGPDILGVCEIENRNVLERLAARIAGDGGRTYKIAHADTGDNRGIDVAFLYDPAIASTSPAEMFQHWIVKRYATRELFQVNFHIDDKIIVLVGNHWPSRSSGQYESEPFRMTAGETLSYWLERIQQELGKDAAIVVIGDFNDEPFNRSIKEYALAINDKKLVKSGRKPYVLNLMWPLLAEGRGSHYYDGDWNMLDQIMISRGIVNGKSGWMLEGNARIEAVSIMTHPKKAGPRRFGFEPKKRDKEGFSDHYPVSVRLRK